MPGAHEAQALLALFQLTGTRAQVALDAAIVQPGQDGLILEDGIHWSPTLTVKRYRTESFSEREW